MCHKKSYKHRKELINFALLKLRQKAQITIPKEIIVKLGLSEGQTGHLWKRTAHLPYAGLLSIQKYI